MKLILVLFFMTQILISQTDEMYIGISKVPPSKNKLKTIPPKINRIAKSTHFQLSS